MTAPGASPRHPIGPPAQAGFGLPGKLLVIIVFMIQFMTILLLGGILVPELRQQGMSTALLVGGAVVAFVLLQLVLDAILKRVPVRCVQCRARSWFAGFGWWPFIYRFHCGACGTERRLEVGGRGGA